MSDWSDSLVHAASVITPAAGAAVLWWKTYRAQKRADAKARSDENDARATR